MTDLGAGPTTKPPANRDTGPAHSVVVGNNMESIAPGAASSGPGQRTFRHH